MPFCRSACIASHDTEILVELVFCPFTFCGAPSGSDEQDESWSYINKKQNRLLDLCENFIGKPLTN